MAQRIVNTMSDILHRDSSIPSLIDMDTCRVPELTFGDISVDKEVAYFTYSVPAGKFNDWY